MKKVNGLMKGAIIGLIIGVVVGLFFTFVVKVHAWDSEGWNFGGYYVANGYNPCPAGTSCVLSSPLTFSAGSSITSMITAPSLPAYILPHVGVLPTITTVNFTNGYLQERNLIYIDSGLYATAGTTSCGIEETINELNKEQLTSEAFIRPENPCILTAPLVLQNVTGVTIGGNGSEGNNVFFIINAPMSSAIYITGTGSYNNVKMGNIEILDSTHNVTGSYISESGNSEGVFHNIKMLSNYNPIYAFYSTGQASEEYSNIEEDTGLGSFFSTTNGNSAQSTKVDNYVSHGGSLVFYTYGGLQVSRIWAGGGGVYITETVAIPANVTPPLKLDQIGYLGNGLNLYGVWNALITSPFIDGGINLDPNCGNIKIIDPNKSTITNNSVYPVYIIGNMNNTPTGKYMQFGSFYGSTNETRQESIVTDNGAITFSTSGIWITTSGNTIPPYNGLHLDNMSADLFTTSASGFTTLTAGFTNVTLPFLSIGQLTFSGLGYGCMFTPINVTNANVHSYGFTPTTVDTFTVVSSSAADTSEVFWECHGD